MILSRFLVLCLTAASAVAGLGEKDPGNLAPQAVISASSELNPSYQARFVADGIVPDSEGKDDAGRAWCVDGASHRDRAEICFEWPQPVTVTEIVYYARTGWFLNEGWKGFEVFGRQGQPLASGELRQEHGPQRISLPAPVETRLIRMVFMSSYQGFNPGASEIQIFSSPPSDAALRLFLRAQKIPGWEEIERTDTQALGELFSELKALHPKESQAVDWPATDACTEDLEREILLLGISRLLVIRRYEIVPSHVYTYHYEGFRPGSSLLLKTLDRGRETGEVELVSSPTGQILDCDLSYDGREILFSWRKQEKEGYHLWVVGVDGIGLRQLTDGPWHDYNPCWLPDGGIAFLSTRVPQFAYCWAAPVGVLHRMDADGSGVRRLSANYLNDFTPAVLNDGRLIYSRWEYVDRPAIPIQSLWTLNPDGTRLAGYFGNRVLSPATFMEARPIPGETRILCTMTGHNGPPRGAIGRIDRSLGVNAQDSIENLTPEVAVPPVDQGCGNFDGAKPYSCPFPLDRLRWMCSMRGPVLVRTFSGACQAIALEAPENGMQYFSAQPVRPRERPQSIPAGAPSPLAGEEEAILFLEDVYRGLAPWVSRGEVVRLRVVREMEKTVRIDPNQRAFGFQFPVISCGATYAGKDVLGEVDLAQDGSAFFKVPAGVPIYFMALDKKGRAVQRMRSFTHLQPGEAQGCVGCHEPRSQTPMSRRGQALAQAPVSLTPPEWGSGGFDYSRIVQPVMDRNCVGCHNARNAPKGIDLSGAKTDFFNVSYETLARENQGPEGSPWVSWIPTTNGQEANILKVTPKTWGSPRSRLAEVLLTGHPDPQGQPRVRLEEWEQRRILAWIDLNVPYYGTSETAYPEKEGCRRILPAGLDEKLQEVATRRCIQCHPAGVPRRVWIRITEPELNAFLLAPLASAAGGTQRCGPIFASPEDADYQAILRLFDPVLQQLKDRPRMDMPGARPADAVCRDRY